MPEVYTNRAPENFNYHANDRPSSRRTKNSRTTPISRPQAEWQRSENYSPISDDVKQTPVRDRLKPPSSPVRDRLKPPSSPVYSKIKPSQPRPELYHLRVDEKHTDRSSPQSYPVEQRRSPMLSTGQRPEMYYLTTSDERTPEYRRPSPSENLVRKQPKSTDNDNNHHHTTPTYSNSSQPGKVTTYMIASSNERIAPGDIERTSSPPIHPAKKKSAVAFPDHNQRDVSNTKHHFPTALYDVPSPTHHTASKATESIQRSMNKYRFGGS